MPVCTEKINGKWRIVNCVSRKVEKNENGKPLDGGGHATKDQCIKQAAAINRKYSSEKW